MTGMFRVFTVALATTLAWPLSLLAQESKPAAATMPSDAELRAAFDRLLATLAIYELDPGIDGIEQAEAREKAIRLAIQKYSDEIRKRALDNATIAALPRDVVALRNTVSPRLSGRVIRVGNGQPFKDLADAQPQLQAGDLVILGEGVFNFADYRKSAPLADIAIVGQGVNRTTIKTLRAGNIHEPERLLVEGVVSTASRTLRQTTTGAPDSC